MLIGILIIFSSFVLWMIGQQIASIILMLMGFGMAIFSFTWSNATWLTNAINKKLGRYEYSNTKERPRRNRW